MFSLMQRADPAVIGLHRIGPQIDGELRLDPQQIAPLHRPVIGELVALQQAIDQVLRLFGSWSARNALASCGGGQRADHVQIDAANKHGIRADRSRLDAQPLQPGEDQFVYFGLGF